MTGWRIGFAVGNREAIANLGKLKTNIDSGVFSAIQVAAIAALKNYDKHIEPLIKIYEERRDVLVDGLNGIGWNITKPKATFYVWTKVPPRSTSAAFATALLEKADIVATPGNGFGEHGEGYIRMALTVDKERLKEAVKRIGKALPTA